MSSFTAFLRGHNGALRSLLLFCIIAAASPRRHAKAAGQDISADMCPSRRFSLVGGQRLSLTTQLWTAVPYTAVAPAQYSGVPDGCTCVNDIQPADQCTVFRCVQGCNLVRGQCDTFCCSDPDCTADQVLAFRAAGRCLPEPTPYQVRKCQDLSTLEKVNVKFRMELTQQQMWEEDGESALSTVLCVAVDNNPIKGNFFETPLELIGTTALLDNPTVNDKPSFGMSAPAATRRHIPRPVNYQAGIQLPAATGTPALVANDPDVLAVTGGGFVRVPIAGPDGWCLDTHFAEFGIAVDQSTNMCARRSKGESGNGETPQEQCELGVFSKTYYLDKMYIGKTPRASIATTSGFVQPTLRNVYARSGNSSVTQDTLMATTSSVATMASSYDTATAVCSNAVTGVNLVIAHNSRGSITGAQVDLFVSDVEMGDDVDAVLTSHGIEFDGFGGNNNTLVVRKVSGNPGYIRGLPLQSGSLVQEAAGTDVERRAIEYNYEGFSVNGPAGAGGACFETSGQLSWWEAALGGTTAAQNYRRVGVDFGVNVQSSCTIELTYDQFTNNAGSWCTDLSTMGLFSLKDNRVGNYGSADPLKEWEWVPVETDTSALVQTAFSASANELTCLNVVSEQHVQVLWTKTGEVNNPQPMVLAVRVRFAQRDWSWAKGAHSPTDKQRFVLSHVVTFVEYDTLGTNLYKPEVPPLLPAIPSDVFYPFDIITSDAMPTAARIGFVGRIATTATVVAVALFSCLLY